MKKEITAADVPAEVWEVWAIQIAGQPVGMVTWERCNEIIKRHPEWFPWEHKYDKIPKSVHEAYKAEAFPPFDFSTLNSQDEFVGIIPELPIINNQNGLSLSEILSAFVKQEKEARERRADKQKKSKALWDKYYSIYGLEYRP